MSRLRGFGFTLDVAGCRTRTWYIDGEGAKRWADNDELVRDVAGQHDLLGKEIKPKTPPAPSFYCYGCAGTRSAKCKKHGTRHCANRRGCNVGGCEACDLDKSP